MATKGQEEKVVTDTNMAPSISTAEQQAAHFSKDGELVTASGEVINASGHVQELRRQYSLWTLCGVAVVIGDCWALMGGSIVIALYNGGAPGVLYEFIVSGFFLLFVTASLAELASAIPSSAGVYQWATVTAGRFGRIVGYYAGYMNYWAWQVAGSGMALIIGKLIVQLWALYHENYEMQRWHVFITVLLVAWGSCAVILFANRWLTWVTQGFFWFVAIGWLISFLVVVIMAGKGGRQYASSDFVWKDWENDTGYTSNGLVFLTGMLNGAFCMETPDAITHLSEEVARPNRNIPIAMFVQMVSSYVTTIIYMIVVFYGISDIDLVFTTSANSPITEIYRQATGSIAGATGLSVVLLLPLVGSSIGTFLTVSRMFWTLARDRAVPFSGVFSKVNPTFGVPVNSIIFCGIVATILDCIYLGNTTAFSALGDSFAILLSLSYLLAILPFLLHGRSNVTPGPFFIKGALGWVVGTVSSVYLSVMIVFYAFPFELPVTAENMNYSSLIVGAFVIIPGIYWIFINKAYTGPPTHIPI